MVPPVDVAVLVVNWNTRDLLASCLESVYRTIARRTFEVVVVDNASTDGSAAMVRARFPSIRLIENAENRGFARAVNQAIQACDSRYVLLLNSDAQLQPGAAAALIAFADEQLAAAVVGCKLLNPDGSFQGAFSDFPTWTSVLVKTAGLTRWIYGAYFPSRPPEESGTVRQVDWVSGACMLVRRAAIDVVGLLDERFFMYSEETDWCYRMHRAGWQIWYLPEARVVHVAGGSSGGTVGALKPARLAQSSLYFTRKHHGAAPAEALRAAIFVIGTLKVLAWSLSGVLRMAPPSVAFAKARASWNLARLRTE